MFNKKFMRDKNYLLLFFGNLVSGVGSRVYGFGISLFLLDLTGQASSTAIYVAVWSVIMFVVGPIAATFTDRWNNKPCVLYVTDYGRALFYLLSATGVTVFLSLSNTTMVLVTIYTALIFIASQTAFFHPTVSAIIPRIVDKDELVSASSIMQITGSIQNIAGLLFGAVLYLNFGIVALMIINAVSFILSAISEMFIQIDGMHDKVESSETPSLRNISRRVYNDLRGALEYLLKSGKPVLMVTVIILISATLVSPWFTIGVPYMFKEYFTFQNIQADYLLASTQFVESIGVILMSLVVAQIASRFKIYQLFRLGGSLFFAIGVLYFMVIRAFDAEVITSNAFIFAYIAINFFAGMVNATINAPLNASLQKYIDPSKIGKISMLINSFGGVLFPLTALAAGYMIDHYSMYFPMLVMVGAMLLMTIISFQSKELQKLA